MFENKQTKETEQQKTIERTFTDKTLGKEEIERIRIIMRNYTLSREQLAELRNLLVGSHLKLVNFDEKDRTIIGYWLNFIENFFQAEEELYAYYTSIKDVDEIQNSTKKLLIKAREKMENNLKFIIDIYLFGVNSSLSIEATGFRSYLVSKFEFPYAESQQVPQEKRIEFFGGMK